VLWAVTYTDESVSLDEDMANWPTDDLQYSGTLRGRGFTATYKTSGDYLAWVCQFREASISGTFSDDFTSFEAQESLIWGPPENETRVERRWHVSRP